MAKRSKPAGPPEVRNAIDIKVRKLGAKGDELRKKIKSAVDHALKQVPSDVLESNETIVIRTNSEENLPQR